MSLSNNTSADSLDRSVGRPDPTGNSLDTASIWSNVYLTEVAPALSAPRSISPIVPVSNNRLPELTSLPELAPIGQQPVMYCQAGPPELPPLPPPTANAPATDTPQRPPRPPQVAVPELADAVNTLRAAQSPNSRQPFHIQVFLAREVGMAALTDAFVGRARGTDPARPGHCDAAIAALQENLRQMRQGTGTGWQIEAAITQGLLGFSQLHRSGIGEDLNRATVARQQGRGGDAARFANDGLTNLQQARESLQALLNPPAGTPPLAANVRQEILSILSTLPQVNNGGPNGALQLVPTYNFSSDPLIQVGMRHGQAAMRGFGR